MKRIAVALLVLFAISIPKAGAYQNITPEEVIQRMESGDMMTIVDVRETYEYEAGFIPGAVNLPWNSGILHSRHEELPMDTDIIVVCRSGNRSVSASNFLDDQEFEQVYNMLGGMLAWEGEVAVPSFEMHFHGPGWIYKNTDDTTFVHCFTDSLDWLEFPPGGMMHHNFPDSVYCLFEEVHPDSMPWPHDSTLFQGYHIQVSNPMGQGMMGNGHMGFQQGIGLHLHYDEGLLGNRHEDGMMLQYWDEDSGVWV